MASDGPTRASVDYDRAWAQRPWLGRLLRILSYLLPTIASFATTFYISRNHPPHEVGIATWQWWFGVLLIGVVVLLATEKLSRRLLPLAALFKISLVFPDEAPSRYRTALKTGTTRQIQRRIDELTAQGIEDDETKHAETMLELVAALSVHDRMTRGHCERVRAYTDMIIDEIGMSEEDAGKLRWAALLHDVGKLFVPYEVLNKEGRPNDREWELLKSHTWRGDELIEPLKPWLGEWAAAVGSHHERWDGAGYPNGLAGNDIHLGARIVAVADTFDVMTSTRSYKKPVPAEDARAEIARCAGGQFDPRVVRAFLNIGIGRLKFAIGPLSWAANLPAAAQTPISAPILATITAALTTTIGFATGTLMPESDPNQPDEIALVVEDDAPADETATLAASTTAPPPFVTTTQPPTTLPPTTLPSTTERPGTTRRPTTTRPAPRATTPTTRRPTPQATTPTTATPTTATPTTAAPPPLAPVANMVPVSGTEDTPLTFALTGQAATNQPIFTIVNQPAFGQITLANASNAGGQPQTFFALQSHAVGAVYQPEANRFGSTSFTYRVCEPAAPFRCALATVPLTIAGADDPLVIGALTASTTEDDAVIITKQSILDQVIELDGEPVTITFGNPVEGSTEPNEDLVDFSPPSNWSGTTTLPVTICEPLRCFIRNITITVAASNDAPVANELILNRNEDALVFVNAADMFSVASDVETSNGNLTFTFSHAGSGNLTPNATGFVFQPPSQSVVTQYVDYTVCDDDPAPLCSSNKVKITLNVVDDPPFAADVVTTVNEDTPVTVGLTELHALVSDPDTADADMTFTFSYGGAGNLVDSPTGFTFTPEQDVVLDQVVTYTACDDTSPVPLCDDGDITMSFTPVNDAPVIDPIADFEAATGIAVGPLAFGSSDVEGDTVTFSSPDLPLGLSLSTAGTLTGTPDKSLRGQTLTVTIVATDDGTPAESSSTTFEIEVNEHGLSPHRGAVRINEVMHRPAIGDGEFAELLFDDPTLDIGGWVLRDSDPAGPNDVFGFTATFNPGATGPMQVVEVGNLILGGRGDDLWLLDDDGLIVDYMGWFETGATGTEFSGRPAAILDIWDLTYEDDLSTNMGPGVSISWAGQVNSNESGCWEHTASGDASSVVGRCTQPNVFVTVDNNPAANRIDSKNTPNYS